MLYKVGVNTGLLLQLDTQWTLRAVRVSTKESRGSVVGDLCERLDFLENVHPANEVET